MRTLVASIGLVLSLIVGVVSVARAEEIGGDFTLIDHNQETFELSQLRGKVVLLFFGYTHCPDICPTELAGIVQLLRALGPNSKKVQGLFVSVDPLRDTPAQLKSYVEYFSNNLIGLSGSVPQLERVKQAYHVQASIYRKNEGDRQYSVDHTANLYVIDQQGKLAGIVPYGFPIEHVQQIVEGLLSQQG